MTGLATRTSINRALDRFAGHPIGVADGGFLMAGEGRNGNARAPHRRANRPARSGDRDIGKFQLVRPEAVQGVADIAIAQRHQRKLIAACHGL